MKLNGSASVNLMKKGPTEQQPSTKVSHKHD